MNATLQRLRQPADFPIVLLHGGVVCERGGGIYYTRVVHRLNNEFTEDIQVRGVAQD
jgi:hypothetical protein